VAIVAATIAATIATTIAPTGCAKIAPCSVCIRPIMRLTGETCTLCSDVNECEEMQINCGPDKRCFNRRGDFQCVDVSCPDNYQRDPQTGYVLSRRIQAWGTGRAVPVTKPAAGYGLEEAVCLGQALKPLLLARFMKMYKRPSASGDPHEGHCPWALLGAHQIPFIGCRLP